MEPKRRPEIERETIRFYERQYQETLKELHRLTSILASFGRRVENAPEIRVKPLSIAPIILDLRAFLRSREEPTHQYDIVKAVGKQRRKKYPTTLRPFGDVWKSLEYQARNDAEIVPVERRGNGWVQVPLKPKPRAPRIMGGQEDSPALYAQPDNLFWFKNEISALRGK